MSFDTTMSRNAASKEKEQVWDSVDDFMSRVKNYPECDTCDCSSLMVTDGYGQFVWMRTEEGRGGYLLVSVSVCLCL